MAWGCMGYKPTAYDIAWTKRLWKHLKVGGLWAYKNKPIAIRKDSKGDATILSFEIDLKELERLRAVMKACGIATVEAERGEESYGPWG